MSDETRARGRRWRNAAIPAVVFGLSLVVAGVAIWIWLGSRGESPWGRELFLRLCLLGLSLGIAAFLCRSLAGARSARLGLLKPEPGDFGAVGWFSMLFVWGVQNAPEAQIQPASTAERLYTWTKVGIIESPVWIVFGLALVSTALFCLIDLAVRRAFARGKRSATD